MIDNQPPEALLKTIKEREHFVLLTHVHPDGDALGSLLGLSEILSSMGKQVLPYLDEPVSHLYNFLPNIARIETNLERVHDFVEAAGQDVAAVALDCGEAARLGEYRDELLKITPFLVIDHHLSHRKYGDQRWVAANCSSTGEMVYELSEALGVALSEAGAFNLYVAIATDTGSFRYECTGARTFEIAGQLIRCGVHPEKVASYLYDNFTKERLRLMEMVLGTLRLKYDDQAAFIHVTRDMFEQSGAAIQDVEGFIDYPRSLKSVKVAVFLKEAKNDLVSVSFRAKGACNVAELAKSFGGGGHRNAAGCRFFDLQLSEVREQLELAVQQVLSAHRC